MIVMALMGFRIYPCEFEQKQIFEQIYYRDKIGNAK